MSQQQITVMWVPGAEDGTVTRVISVPMFSSNLINITNGARIPYNTYEIPIPDTAKVTWLNSVASEVGNVASPTVLQKTASTASRFRFSKANALVVAIMVQASTFSGDTTIPFLYYGPAVSLTGATKIFDGTGILINTATYTTAIPTITDAQLPNKYLLLRATNSGVRIRSGVVIEDDNPIRG